MRRRFCDKCGASFNPDTWDTEILSYEELMSNLISEDVEIEEVICEECREVYYVVVSN